MKKQVKEFFKFLKDVEGRDISLKHKLLKPKLFPLTQDDLYHPGDLFLFGEPIKTLPNGLTVGGDLNLGFSKLQSIPDNLTVGSDRKGNLALYRTAVSNIPSGLKVSGFLTLGDTPLAKMYTASEIRDMIESKGGMVLGEIHIKN